MERFEISKKSNGENGVIKVIKKMVKHFCLVTKHRWLVFKLSIRAGIPWRGLVHDLSKYSPTEFLESVKYYTGDHSPIDDCRRDKGYSEAILHHYGRNKHHVEYWIDIVNGEFVFIIMPFKYACELICDEQAAGMAYMGKKWTQGYELEYWKKHKHEFKTDERIKDFIEKAHTEVAEKGIKETINKANLKRLYKECVEDKL